MIMWVYFALTPLRTIGIHILLLFLHNLLRIECEIPGEDKLIQYLNMTQPVKNFFVTLNSLIYHRLMIF